MVCLGICLGRLFLLEVVPMKGLALAGERSKGGGGGGLKAETLMVAKEVKQKTHLLISDQSKYTGTLMLCTYPPARHTTRSHKAPLYRYGVYASR